MQLTEIDGTVLNAAWSVEHDGDLLAVILESAGGKTKTGASRNSDYTRALVLLVSRLRELGAVIEDALVDSAQTASLSEADRRLIDAPLPLATTTATNEEIRLLLTRKQGRIGMHPDAKKSGNERKRLRLRVAVPGYTPELLARDLSGAVESPVEKMLLSLDTLNVQRYPDGTTKRHQPLTLLWAIGRAVEGKERQVPWREARSTIGSLIEGFGHPADSPKNAHLPFLALAGSGLWELSATPPAKGKNGDPRLRWLNAHPETTGGLTEESHQLFAGSRLAVSSAVDRLLLDHFDGTDERPLLAAVGLGATAPAVEARRRTYTGKLSYDLVVLRRGEQHVLRRLLLGRGVSQCALCGAELPERLLVAAHIKRRTACDERERRDLDNVAMLACTLGCDSLYEHGYIGISDDGVVELSPELLKHPHLHAHAQPLEGRPVAAWTGSSRDYFAWHAANVFRAQARDEPPQDR
ncbi:HNH endonuclease [Herbidospora cretacea]|uniref:HNH endonuclease n=1 Tax=Herbidospora cretacea TaxID=28444 RepID=UPI00068A77D2|nr:HNH endonuclease [Herbidospora cretacea]